MLAADEFRGTIGWRRILALGFLLATVAAVATLQAALAGSVDLSLLYFAIVLGGALLLPLPVALALAGATALVSVYVTRGADSQPLISFVARLVLYRDCALPANKSEPGPRQPVRLQPLDELSGLLQLQDVP